MIMKHEHANRTKFKLSAGGRQYTIGVHEAVASEDGFLCEQCCFLTWAYDYSCGYGFRKYGCKAGGCEIAKCRKEYRTDNLDIIYIKL